jgi:hypothetical protein
MAKIVHGSLVALKWLGIGLLALIALVVLGSLLVPPLAAPFTERWGATDSEVAERLPGDVLVPAPRQSSTKAVTIAAPADTVYSLVVQMGYKRAGWAGWDWFYDLTGSSGFVDGRSSRRIVAELQNVAPGDMVYINKMVGYQVVTAQRPRSLVLYGGTASDGSFIGPTEQLPAKHTSMSWDWEVLPLSRDRTRLILRIRSEMAQQGGFVTWLFDQPLEFGGALFGHKTLVGLKGVAEALAQAK